MNIYVKYMTIVLHWNMVSQWRTYFSKREKSMEDKKHSSSCSSVMIITQYLPLLQLCWTKINRWCVGDGRRIRCTKNKDTPHFNNIPHFHVTPHFNNTLNFNSTYFNYNLILTILILTIHYILMLQQILTVHHI